MKIYNGYERLPRNYTIATDEYEYSMANGYLLSGKKDDEAVFDIFFRKVPNNGGYALADIMTLKGQPISKDNLLIISPQDYFKQSVISDFELVKLQQPIFVKGELVYDDPDILEKRDYCNKQMKTLYPEIKRTMMPHEYYVDGTKEYVDMKNNLISETKRKVLTNK